jgi:2-dehydropantoate 2-reductase
MLKIDEGATSSMYEDIKSKRNVTEIQYLQGEIVRLGKEYHVATPMWYVALLVYLVFF